MYSWLWTMHFISLGYDFHVSSVYYFISDFHWNDNSDFFLTCALYPKLWESKIQNIHPSDQFDWQGYMMKHHWVWWKIGNKLLSHHWPSFEDYFKLVTWSRCFCFLVVTELYRNHQAVANGAVFSTAFWCSERHQFDLKWLIHEYFMKF